MTDEERDQVVEVLRCAADVRPIHIDVINGLYDAAFYLWVPADVCNIAVAAKDATSHLLDLQSRYLEAAVCLEEGSWP